MKAITLGQSTVYMTLASIAQKIISFVYFAIIARSLGAEDTGKYFFALSFTTIFVVFIDLGLTNVLVREGAKTKEKIVEFVSGVLFLKIFLGIGTYLVMAVVLSILGYAIDMKMLVFISGITMLFDSLQLSLYGTLRALGNVKYEAFGIVGSQGTTLILGTIFLYFKLPITYLMIAFLIPSFLNTAFAYTILVTRYNLRLRPKFIKGIILYIIPIAVPFALATVFGRVFSYADSVMLSKMAGNAAVGWYSVPYKIAYAFQFIPFALIAGLYPRMSEYYVHDQKRLGEVFNQGLRYLLIVSVPMSVGIIILGTKIIQTFFGNQYLPSIMPLQILMAGVITSFLNVLLGALLNATGRQKTQTIFVGLVMVCNIILNVILIPRFGVVGAATAATTGNTILFVLSWIMSTRIVTVDYSKLGMLLLKLVLSTGIMAIVVWYTPQLHVLIRAGIGGIVCAVTFVLLKGFDADDILYFKTLRTKNTETI